MKYEQKSFTVPASSSKVPENCQHGWVDARHRCVLCGHALTTAETAMRSLREKVEPLRNDMALAVARQRGTPCE